MIKKGDDFRLKYLIITYHCIFTNNQETYGEFLLIDYKSRNRAANAINRITYAYKNEVNRKEFELIFSIYNELMKKDFNINGFIKNINKMNNIHLPRGVIYLKLL